jgi:hypothetical protein
MAGFTLYVLGREVLSIALELPVPPSFSEVTSLIAAEREEPEAAEEYEEEEEDTLTRRVRGQVVGF